MKPVHFLTVAAVSGFMATICGADPLISFALALFSVPVTALVLTLSQRR